MSFSCRGSSNRQIEKRRKDPEEDYFDTIHYYDIVLVKEHKKLFVQTFTPPRLEQSKELNKLKWFIRFNNIRKKYSHSEGDNVSEDELLFLKDLEQWLFGRILPFIISD